MITYELAQVVKSAAGRDKDDYFLILDFDDDYVYLVDGKHRRLEKPKKKKKKHIAITHYVSEDVKNKLSSNTKLSNADIRRSIKMFLKTY